MPTGPIPFINMQASGLEELGGASPISMNVIAEPGSGVVKRRPGIRLAANAPSSQTATAGTSVNALWATVGGKLYAVYDTGTKRSIKKVTAGGITDLSTNPDTDLRGTLRPVIAETESILVFTGGREPQKLELATEVSSRLGGTPPEGSHVIANNSRLLINHVLADLGQVNFSAPSAGSSFSGFEDWSSAITTGFFTGESRPDPVVALADNTNEVFLFGTGTTQIFAPDPQQVYSPVSTREIGCAAPYSIVKVDQSFFWLDHLRRFIMSDGRQFQEISNQVQQTLDDMGTVSDCFGFRWNEGAADLIVWVFPTEKRIFAFQKEVGWSQWSGWDADNAIWTELPIASHFLRLDTNQNLIGTTDGRICELLSSELTDLDEAPINAYVVTGFLDRDTDSLKKCNALRISLRRGETTGTDEPCALVSWRDGPGAWEEPIPISLGFAGDVNPVVTLYSLGVYRRRQWKFTFTGTDALALVTAREDFEVLSN